MTATEKEQAMAAARTRAQRERNEALTNYNDALQRIDTWFEIERERIARGEPAPAPPAAVVAAPAPLPPGVVRRAKR